MARRIRTIKPELWESEDFTSLPVPARLTFIGLLNYADDYGRFKAVPPLVKAAVWPLDEDVLSADVTEHIDLMVGRGMLRRYEVDGRGYFEFVNWSKHQRVDKPSKSDIPEPLASDSRDSREGSWWEGEGEGKGKEGERASAPPPGFCPEHPRGTRSSCRACADARRARAEWDATARSKPTTPGIITEPDCELHPGRPARTCDRCAELAVAS